MLSAIRSQNAKTHTHTHTLRSAQPHAETHMGRTSAQRSKFNVPRHVTCRKSADWKSARIINQTMLFAYCWDSTSAASKHTNSCQILILLGCLTHPDKVLECSLILSNLRSAHTDKGAHSTSCDRGITSQTIHLTRLRRSRLPMDLMAWRRISTCKDPLS